MRREADEPTGGGAFEDVEESVRHRIRQGLVLAQIVVRPGTLPPIPAQVRAEIGRMAATYEDPCPGNELVLLRSEPPATRGIAPGGA